MLRQSSMQAGSLSCHKKSKTTSSYPKPSIHRETGEMSLQVGAPTLSFGRRLAGLWTHHYPSPYSTSLPGCLVDFHRQYRQKRSSAFYPWTWPSLGLPYMVSGILIHSVVQTLIHEFSLMAPSIVFPILPVNPDNFTSTTSQFCPYL